ncbi:Kiwa anti-phage protein KwaB-like domain-containing protein [Nocardia cyriacigeorgica]|uniref:Kiwa anti-phage protein KwaB-like domain-containing protein n=1 Tax=Nocardia cyriacigeorgica TaxID=135487 RepID=UPI002455A8EA|nr:hypothetical protein [Nocardia cyriacigeorgica]
MRTSQAWADTDIAGEPIDLLLGWRDGRKRLQALRIEFAAALGAELRGIAAATLDRIGAMAPIDYDTTATLVDGEEFFSFPLDRLTADAAPGEPDAHITQLLRLIARSATLDTVLPRQMRDGTFLFYVLICESAGPDRRRTAFVRLQHGLRVASAHRILATFGERLNRVGDPVFAFAEEFDLVIAADEIAILKPDTFLRLFTDLELLTKATPEFVDHISESLGLDLTDEVKHTIVAVCAKRPSYAKLLKRIHAVDYLPKITLTSLRTEIERYPELPEGIEVDDTGIVLSEQGVPTFLDILDQRIWRGPFDDSSRVATAYRRLRPP